MISHRHEHEHLHEHLHDDPHDHTHDVPDQGKVPSQWFVRILGLAAVAGVVAAVVGTFDEIKRYARIKQM